MSERDRQPPHPYVGPRPFNEAEEGLFFGRTREIEALRALITAHQVVLLYAESGAGKTSLLQAGLVPSLRRRGFEVFPATRVGAAVPGRPLADGTNVFVHNAILQWLSGAETESQADTTIAEHLASRAHSTDANGFLQPRLLVFDQLEELFVDHPSRWADRKGFFVQVCDALRRDSLLRVLFVVREDFLASFVPYESLFADKLRNRFRLERLRREAALAAVAMPLVATERSFAPGVAEELVRKLSLIHLEGEGRVEFVEGEFVEPVQLQVVCQQLWDSLPSGATEITPQHLKAVGDLHVVLARYYEGAIRRVGRKTRTREAALRRLFDRHLITSTGTRGTMHVEARRTAGVPSEAIDSLEAERILRSERRAGARWIEIPHDSLVEPIRQSNARWAARRKRAFAVVGAGLALAAAVALSVVFATRHTKQLEKHVVSLTVEKQQLGQYVDSLTAQAEQLELDVDSLTGQTRELESDVVSLTDQTRELESDNARIAWVASRLDVASARLAMPGAPDRSYGVFDDEFGDALPNVALAYATAAGLGRQRQSAPLTNAGHREFMALRRLAIGGNKAERRAAGIALVGPLSQWNWIPKWLSDIASDRANSPELRSAAAAPLAVRWAMERSPDGLRELAGDPAGTEEIRYAAARAYYRALRGTCEPADFHAMCERDARTQDEIELGWAAGESLALDYAAARPSALEALAKRAATPGLRKAAALALSARLAHTASSYRDVLPTLLGLEAKDGPEYREAIISAFAELYLQESPTAVCGQLLQAVNRTTTRGPL